MPRKFKAVTTNLTTNELNGLLKLIKTLPTDTLEEIKEVIKKEEEIRFNNG